MKPTDEDLMAYADGELPEDKQAEIESAIADAPGLMDIIEQHRAMRIATQAAYREVDSAPMSEGLAVLTAQMRADIAPAAAHQDNNAARILWPLAAAATFVIGLMGSQLVQAPQYDESRVLIAQQDGRPIAGRILSDALSELPGATPQTSVAGTLTINASFISGEGQYCRQFHISNDDLTGGIACRQDDTWQVITLADLPKGSDGQYQPAGVETDPLALIAVRLGVQKKLSPEEEAELIELGWE